MVNHCIRLFYMLLIASMGGSLFCQEVLVSIQIFGNEAVYIGCTNEEARIIEVKTEEDKEYTTFRLVKGLANEELISFESALRPSYYLRHQNGIIKLHEFRDTGLFKRDATFNKIVGLIAQNDPSSDLLEAVSFESYNYPNHYVRHRDGRLLIEKYEDSGTYRRNVSFILRSPNWNGSNPVAKKAKPAHHKPGKEWFTNLFLFAVLAILFTGLSVSAAFFREYLNRAHPRKITRRKRSRPRA